MKFLLVIVNPFVLRKHFKINKICHARCSGTIFVLEKAMKVAITEFNGRVSPVFDTCRFLRLFDTAAVKDASANLVGIGHVAGPFRASYLKKIGVDAVICGAVSGQLATNVASLGIRLYPYFSGDVESVFLAFVRGELDSPGYMMPGCGRGRGRGRRRGRGKGRGMGRGPGRGRKWEDV